MTTMPSDQAPGRITGDKENPWNRGWKSLLAPALVYGFGSAVGLWCLWYILHLPGMSLKPGLQGPVLLVGQAVAATIAAFGLARSLGSASVVKAGALAGVVAAAVNLLLLGATINGKDPSKGLVSVQNLAVAIPGFFLLGAAIGAMGGAVIRAATPRPAPTPASPPLRHWVARFAAVTAVAFLPLMLAGGLVTSTESGMAVPDWPGTNGMNMFLYPLGAMAHPRVTIEHMHRLFGSMVGVTTLVMMILVLATEKRPKIKVWAVAVFLAVVAQGLLGAGRVLENNPKLGAVHGVLAQLVFTMAVALAAYLTLLYEGPHPAVEGDRKRRGMATGLLHAMLLQLILGAAYRHLGHKHILYTHAAFAIVVLIFAVIVALLAIKRAKIDPVQGPMSRTLAFFGKALMALVMLQFVLGWVAFLVVLSAKQRGPIPTSTELTTAPPVPVLEALVTTAHQTNGALLLAIVTIVAVFCRQIWRSQAGKAASAKASAA